MALIELTWKCTKCGTIGNETTPGIDRGMCLKCQGLDHEADRNKPRTPAQDYEDTYEDLWNWYNEM